MRWLGWDEIRRDFDMIRVEERGILLIGHTGKHEMPSTCTCAPAGTELTTNSPTMGAAGAAETFLWCALGVFVWGTISIIVGCGSGSGGGAGLRVNESGDAVLTRGAVAAASASACRRRARIESPTMKTTIATSAAPITPTRILICCGVSETGPLAATTRGAGGTIVSGEGLGTAAAGATAAGAGVFAHEGVAGAGMA